MIALICCAMLAMRLRRVRSDQRVVLGERREDLVENAAELNRHVAELHRFVDQETLRMEERVAAAERRLDGAVTRTAVIRYDAFNETSGRQSSSVALLDDRGDGVILSAILQREQARVYAKPVVRGEATLDLSPEERAAMDEANAGRGDYAQPAEGD